MSISLSLSYLYLVVIVDPGIDIDKGYIPYDHGLAQDIFLKVSILGLSPLSALIFNVAREKRAFVV